MEYNFNIKYIIMKIQDYLSQLVRSKAFIYAVITIILGFIVVGFTVKNRADVNENFYFNDALEKRQAEKELSEYQDITMSEINRISKLLTFFFNDVIITKNAEVEGLSELYRDYDNYDMQILKASKAGNKYETLIVIALPIKNGGEELMFAPAYKYQVVIEGTNKGMKVEYINTIE